MNRKTVIHQPNFSPWAGYFFKLMHGDVFIVLDDVEYSKNNIINRNRIYGSNGVEWLTVPVESSNSVLIKDIRISGRHWIRKSIRTIENNYSGTPYFNEYFYDIKKILEREHEFLIDLNMELINYFLKVLNIKIKILFSSQAELDCSKEKRLIELVKWSEGRIYISGQGGKKYLDKANFDNENIIIKYSEFRSIPYNQKGREFQRDLSILDLLFNLGKVASIHIKNNGIIK